ncbi:hypothetical protein HK097_006791 [Rhizophlyctis rosea]|uniref:Uncharacterized protein n=1 Tax=Rhizophlyctis rosea TaxID=64517 RepID=A0AAD5X4P9_9FUNG|nr:hypothetical protein HK097_006791 [Rhizophlyctis rosea]
MSANPNNTPSAAPQVSGAADKPSFGGGKTEPSLLHAASEAIAGNVQATVGSITGNKDAQIEGTARSTTAYYEKEAAKGYQISRN